MSWWPYLSCLLASKVVLVKMTIRYRGINLPKYRSELFSSLKSLVTNKRIHIETTNYITLKRTSIHALRVNEQLTTLLDCGNDKSYYWKLDYKQL